MSILTNSDLKVYYQSTVRPALKQELKLTNDMAVPRLTKVSLNVGLSQGKATAKLEEVVLQTLSRITGQKPVLTRAKKSISNFKIREGQAVGAMVTLRGARMYSFVEKLIRVALPRVRDFRGLPVNSIDGSGNLTIGFREHMVFPEIRSDEIESVHGLQVTISTTAGSKARGQHLFQLLGFPFSD